MKRGPYNFKKGLIMSFGSFIQYGAAIGFSGGATAGCCLYEKSKRFGNGLKKGERDLRHDSYLVSSLYPYPFLVPYVAALVGASAGGAAGASLYAGRRAGILFCSAPPKVRGISYVIIAIGAASIFAAKKGNID